MKRMVDVYQQVQELLTDLAHDRSIRGDMRAKLSGLARKAEDLNTYRVVQIKCYP